MKLRSAHRILVLLCCLFFGITGVSLAEDRAMEKLLETFEKKGLITPSEVEMIRDAMAEDQEGLLKREREMEEKERALERREKELKEREDNLGLQEEKVVGAYEEGLCLSTGEPERFSLCLGGILQADYRYFDYDEGDPEENKFDLRRVRLLVSGEALGRYGYEFEYEFEGAEARNLVDAYVDARLFPFASFRIGQFKEPFSLEHCTLDSLGFFAERSMGFYLTPRRDVGLMAHGSLWEDRIHYGLGVFNGDGLDNTQGGDVDSPEYTGRWVFAPSGDQGMPWWDGFQIGGSMSYANIDRNNVEVEVKTTGMTTFFDVASSGKFNIIRDADNRFRYGAELAWTLGPVAVAGEYFHAFYENISTSAERFDFEMEDYYVSLLWIVTGERPTLRKGVFQPIRPERSVWEGGWGAIGLAFRYDAFEADEIVYDVLVEAGNSVREADAYTIAINWYLDETIRLVLDATRTKFDRPLLIDRGESYKRDAVYSDCEDVITGRFQFSF